MQGFLRESKTAFTEHVLILKQSKENFFATKKLGLFSTFTLGNILSQILSRSECIDHDAKIANKNLISTIQNLANYETLWKSTKSTIYKSFLGGSFLREESIFANIKQVT